VVFMEQGWLFRGSKIGCPARTELGVEAADGSRRAVALGVVFKDESLRFNFATNFINLKHNSNCRKYLII